MADGDRHGGQPARDGAQAIRRAVTLLREVAAARGAGASLGDLSEAAGLTQPTAHRVLHALVDEKLLVKDGTRRYRPGPLLYELGLAAAPRLDLRGLCRPILERLAMATGDTVYLNIRSGLDALCLDLQEGGFPIKAVPVTAGNRRPLGVGAAALAVLAGLPAEEIRDVIAANRRRYRRYGLTPEQVLESVAAAQARGYAASTGRFVPSYRGVAVSISDERGGLAAALSVVAITDRLGPDRAARTALQLRREALALRAMLGGANSIEDEGSMP